MVPRMNQAEDRAYCATLSRAGSVCKHGLDIGGWCTACRMPEFTKLLRESQESLERLNPLRTHAEARAAGRTLSELTQLCGSYRRMLEAYWAAELTPEEERILEDKISEERRIAYRPIV